MRQPRYRAGDRVMLTETARRANILVHIVSKTWPIYGTVASDQRGPSLVMVRRDGTKYPTSYHVSYWRPCPPAYLGLWWLAATFGAIVELPSWVRTDLNNARGK